MLSAIGAPNTWSIPYSRRAHFRKRRLGPTRIQVSAAEGAAGSFSSSPSSSGRNGASQVEYTPWLIAGLGNPGNKYSGTRHNVGFEMIDKISEKEGILLNTIQSKALIGIGSIGPVPVLLAKPQSYINYSGESGHRELLILARH